MVRLYFVVFLPVSLLILWLLLLLFRTLVDQQVNDQVSKFAEEAKIPKVLRSRIGISLKWRW